MEKGLKKEQIAERTKRWMKKCYVKLRKEEPRKRNDRKMIHVEKVTRENK